MKSLSLVMLLLLTSAVINVAHAEWDSGDWKFKPVIYARGGLTIRDDLAKTVPEQPVTDATAINQTNDDIKNNDTTNYGQSWNLGAYGEESNAVSNTLTELAMEITYKNWVKYVYGVDTKKGMRFFEHDRDDRNEGVALRERENYVQFFERNYSLWLGQRAYRGTGEFLTGQFPFDELNLYGGGVRIEEVGPINLEFAYGVKEGNDLNNWNDDSIGYTGPNEIDSQNINIFVNKIEVPYGKGMVKTNFEYRQNNAQYGSRRTTSYVAGLQFQRWGDRVLGGRLYNIAYVNYSKGHIPEGAMSSVMDNTAEDKKPSKLVLKYGGDWKATNYGAYWNLEYHQHEGTAWPYNTSETEEAKWIYTDVYFRPVFVINPTMTWGIDYVQRIIFEDNKMTNTSMAHAFDSGSTRFALMLAYNMARRPFDAPNISLFIGRMIKDKPTVFFPNDIPKREENFIRLNYTVSI